MVYTGIKRRGNDMDKTQKIKFYKLVIPAIIVGIIMIVWIISMLLKPKIDYTAMATDLLKYAYTFDNVQNMEAVSNSMFNITVKNDAWYASSERDKMLFCKKLNEGIISICWKYKAIKDTQIAYVYYYDEDGIKIAEPGKGLTTESIILH